MKAQAHLGRLIFRRGPGLGLLPASVLTLVCTISSPGPALAQSGPADAAFGESVDVELVNVEVWVTDSDGRPVDGLPAEAFRLEQDGDPVDIAYFSEVRPPASEAPDGRAAEDPVGDASPDAAPSPDRSSPDPSPGDRGHLVLYFDQLHLTPRGQAQIVDDLEGLLDSGALAPEQVMVLRQDQSLYIEAPFGSSRAQVLGAIDRVAEREPQGAAVELERQATLRRLQERWEISLQTAGVGPVSSGEGGQEAACTEFIRVAVPEIQTHAERGRQRISTTLDHLHGVAGFLSALDGTKSLVYVSDTLEIQPGTGLYGFVDGLCPGRQLGRIDPRQRGELDRPFYELSRAAAANRVTFYGLQAGGLRAQLTFGADQSSLDLRGTQRLQTALREAERAGLLYLSAETGGRAIYNRNSLQRDLFDVARELGSYYSLAFVPSDPGTGHEHRLEVRLADAFDRRGLRVRHRKGYLHKSAEARLSERLDAALFLGLGENPLTVRLGVGDASPTESARKTPKTFDVPLHVYVPVRSVTFVPSGDGTMARVFVRIAARDADGDRTELARRVWKIEGPAAEDGLLDLRFDLRLGPGLRTLAVAVRDELSRETSFVSTTLAVPSPGPPVAAY